MALHSKQDCLLVASFLIAWCCCILWMSQETECSEKDGWCLPETIDKCRVLVTAHFASSTLHASTGTGYQLQSSVNIAVEWTLFCILQLLTASKPELLVYGVYSCKTAAYIPFSFRMVRRYKTSYYDDCLSEFLKNCFSFLHLQHLGAHLAIKMAVWPVN